MRVYEIPTQYRQFFEASVNEDGELIYSEEEFEELEAEATDKIANCGRMLKEWQAELEAMKEAKRSIDARMKTKTRQIEWLKEMTLNALSAVGKKVEAADIVVTTRKSTKVQVNEDLLGADWFVEKIERRPNLTALGDALKQGFEIEGAELVTNYNLSLK